MRGAPLTEAYDVCGIGTLNRRKCSFCAMSMQACLDAGAYGIKNYSQCSVCTGWFCHNCAETLKLKKQMKDMKNTSTRQYNSALDSVDTLLNRMIKTVTDVSLVACMKKTVTEFDTTPFSITNERPLAEAVPLFKAAVAACDALNGTIWKTHVIKRKWDGGPEYAVSKKKQKRD